MGSSTARTPHAALLCGVGVALLVVMGSCKQRPAWERGKKVAHLALRAKVGSLDPVKSSTQYAGLSQAQIYEPLFSYKYLVRPYELEPLLAAEMPDISDDGLVYTIKLREGVLFHDNECFEESDGIGREMVAQDFIYSLKRMTDKALNPGGWWLYQDRIVGFDAYQQRMQERDAGEPFDWDADIEGLQTLDDHTIQIKLLRPFPQFLFILAMGYTAVMPRECAEYYGLEFGANPVGTGPFMLRSWSRGNRLVLDANPKYRHVEYPSEASEEAIALGLDAPAGQKIPFLDAIVFHIFEQDQPMWLKFRVGDIDMVQVPAEYHDAIFHGDNELRPKFVKGGVHNYNLPLLDFIYRGFNMEDELIGLPGGDSARYLRQAISMVWDTGEVNDAFYNNTCILYDGPIPPGLDGYKKGITSPYRGPNIDAAKELLAKAGYPEGKGLPALQYEISRSGNSQEQAEMFTRQLKKIGVKIDVNTNSFPELSDKLKRKKAQMFGLAWGADYPDAENFLQLFYGPNEAPGSNNFNYKNPEYDALYNQTRTMLPSPERTAIYEQMREMLIEDVASFGSMARTRFYVWNDRLKNAMPAEVWYHWYKYLDVEIDD